MNYIGIDPGLKGAVALLRPDSQALFDLPTKPDEVYGRRIDCNRLAQLLQDLLAKGDDGRVRVCIEAMANGGENRGNFNSVGSQFWTQSAIVNTIELLGLEVEVSVHVVTWKGLYGFAGKSGETGPEAIKKIRRVACELYPALADMLQRQNDHNRAEALLIAHWFRKVKG